MARAKIGIDFAGVFELQNTLASLGDAVLQKAVVNALGASKDYVNDEIQKAMDASPYHFDGTKYSLLKTQKGLNKVEQMDVEIKGAQAVAYAGVSFYDAPELWYIANGAPNTPKDQNLYNSVRVKGKVKQRVEEIQKEEFNKVIEEALNRG